ncbi:MAG: hypothetical protein H6839_14445 [Planctomycetes bacterium]|nr:hypothetical protein [Planctomycetota bacterium]
MLRALSAILLALPWLLASGSPLAQDAAWTLTRVNGNDGKAFRVEVSRRGGAPEVRPNGSSYFLGGDQFTEDPPVWYVDGTTVSPVLGYKRGSGKRVSLELVQSGGATFITYVRDGVNEFWKLKGAEAEQVRLNTGKAFAMRARITRGGERVFLYDTDYEGRNSIYEIKGTTAEPLVLSDKANHGGASYAWWTDNRLLVAFYSAGTYDFYWLKDGTFVPCWERNGVEDYDRQVDRILSLIAGGRLYLNVVCNDKSASIWTVDADGLAPVVHADAARVYAWDDGARTCVNDAGLYFVAENQGKQNQVFLANGASITPLKSGDGPLVAAFIHCKGGAVLAGGSMIDGTSATPLPADESEQPGTYELAARLGGFDLLQRGSKLYRYQQGKLNEQKLEGAPADFGRIVGSWNVGERAYLIERVGGDLLEFRLWKLE